MNSKTILLPENQQILIIFQIKYKAIQMGEKWWLMHQDQVKTTQVYVEKHNNF